MNDYEAIRRVMADYCFGTDMNDVDLWAGCFTDDIVWEGGAFGRFEGRTGAHAYMAAANGNSLNFRHINTNPCIDIEGDRAIVRSHILVFDQTGPSPTVIFSGFYDDVFERRAGNWLIRSRQLVSNGAEMAARRMKLASAA